MPDTTTKTPKKPPLEGMTTRGTPRKIKPNRADATLVQEAVGKIPRALRRNHQRTRVLGLDQRAAIYQMHVREGKTLSKVADLLGVSVQAVQNHWEIIQREIIQRAPTTEEDFLVMRERVAAMLWRTVEDTCVKNEIIENGEETVIEVPPNPKLLTVRVSALSNIAKLYGVNLEREAAPMGPQPYAAPAEVAELAKQKLLELHNVESANS